MKIEKWTEKYETLENKVDMDVSWTFLHMRFDTLNEAHNEVFDVDGELEKAKEAIETT